MHHYSAMHIVHRDSGWIEVICGPMFSGKSEELIRRLKRGAIARRTVQSFKASIDIRYDQQLIVSHSQQTIDATAAKSSAELAALIRPGVEIVGIDEIQFFDHGIVDVVERLAQSGVRVIVAGLDQDYRGKPFEPVPTLMALAEYVTKTLAICMVCGDPANRSQRMSGGAERVAVGAADSYEARCRACHVPDVIPQTGSLPL